MEGVRRLLTMDKWSGGWSKWATNCGRFGRLSWRDDNLSRRIRIWFVVILILIIVVVIIIVLIFVVVVIVLIFRNGVINKLVSTFSINLTTFLPHRPNRQLLQSVGEQTINIDGARPAVAVDGRQVARPSATDEVNTRPLSPADWDQMPTWDAGIRQSRALVGCPTRIFPLAPRTDPTALASWCAAILLFE